MQAEDRASSGRSPQCLWNDVSWRHTHRMEPANLHFHGQLLSRTARKASTTRQHRPLSWQPHVNSAIARSMMCTCLNNQTEPQHTIWWNTNKKHLSPPDRSTSLQMEQFYLRFNQKDIVPINAYLSTQRYHKVLTYTRKTLPASLLEGFSTPTRVGGVVSGEPPQATIQ